MANLLLPRCPGSEDELRRSFSSAEMEDGTMAGDGQHDDPLITVVPSEATLHSFVSVSGSDHSGDTELCSEHRTTPSVTVKKSWRRRFQEYGKSLPADPAFSLYCAKFLQAWGDRMWIFSIPILLLDLHRPPLPPLFLPALYGFCSGASTILFGPVMGEWVDHTSRLNVFGDNGGFAAAKVIAFCQNGLIGIAGIALSAVMFYKEELSSMYLFLCIGGLMVLSFCANIFYAASVVVIEKDWVAVIGGKDKRKLADLISCVRRIELLTNVVCPLFMAQIMSYRHHGKALCALVIGIWSLCSLFAEYCVLRRTWQLAETDMTKARREKPRTKKPLVRKLCRSCFAIYEGWSIFIRSKICTAGLGVAFLEATVLVFSGVTTSYAVQQGISSTAVALLSGCDALTGILSTFIFPVIRTKMSLVRITLIAMVFHFVLGGACVSSNWLDGSPFDPRFFLSSHPQDGRRIAMFSFNNVSVSEHSSFNETTLRSVETSSSPIVTSLVVFSVGVITSRLAFWMIDLAVSQLLLENIKDGERGTICAVHYSLKKLMNRVKYVLAMFLSWPQTFGFLVIASQLFNMIGYGFFIVYCRRKPVRNFKIHAVR